MNKNIILTADVLDIIFDGRNKAYGAYDLRKTYQERVFKALLGTVGICLLFFAFLYGGADKKAVDNPVKVIDYNLQQISEAKKPIVIPPPPLPKPVQVKVQITAFKPPIIVPDNQVTETPPEVKTLDNTHIGLTNQDGIKGGDDVIAPPEQSTTSNGNGLSAQKKDDPNDIFHSVQIEAEFPGGKAAWMRYLERNLNNNLPTEECAPAGKYTVFVSFMVDQNGFVSDVVAENNPQYGTAEEAVKVIKKGPKWTPAVQNGHNVAYRVRQAITFVVNDNL